MVNAERPRLDKADAGGVPWRRLLPASGWLDNQSCRNMVAWSWAGNRGVDRFTDILSQSPFERDGAGLASPGLFVDLGPWQFQLLAAR